jgi:hypothetical protein
MTLPESIVNYFDSKVVQSYQVPLVGVNLIAKGDPLPPGTGRITRDQVSNFTGKAKRGYRVRTVPREMAERIPKTVTVVEHTYGFEMHRKVLELYEREGETALNGQDATQCGRVIAQSLDDIIFNGDKNAGVKGIFSDAGLTPYVVPTGHEWNNTSGAAPDTTIVAAMAELAGPQLYTNMDTKLALNPSAYWELFKRVPNTSNTYMDYVAKFFKNGQDDIVQASNLPVASGLLCYYDPLVAERNVEEEINTRVVNGGVPDKEDMIYFNGATFQATDIHHLDAFLPLNNLIDTTLPL